MPFNTKQTPTDEICYFASTSYHNKNIKFGIKKDDRRRHVYIVGKTGMGKTNLLENMIFNDIMSGHGCCYVDPHGDTAEKILSFIPSHRINDVIYFNPSDLEHPIAFNVLESVDPRFRHLVASGLVAVFKKLWADSWGPRLEYILRYCILALLDYPGSTLLGINRMLYDKAYRGKVVEKITDPVVRAFWMDEFPKWNDRVLQEVISPIQNKVGQFLSTALIRNIVGQVLSTINIRKIMDEKKILILNLSKGRIGEDASKLLGAMLITKIQLAAMSRVDIPEEERADFYLYVDEFQNFATDSFADILSEARKYRLNLIIAHQYIEQLGEVVKPAVFGNVGTMIVFRVGAADAEELEKEFEPFLTIQDIVNLPKYHIYLKLMIDGVTSDPFSAVTLPPLSQRTYNEEKIIQSTRERYTVSRELVEDKIRRWSESSGPTDSGQKQPGPRAELERPHHEKRSQRVTDLSKKQAPRPSEKKSVPAPQPAGHTGSEERGERRKHDINIDTHCTGCGVAMTIHFKPDGVRPVYCKECLKKSRRGELTSKKPQIPAQAQNEFTGKIRIVQKDDQPDRADHANKKLDVQSDQVQRPGVKKETPMVSRSKTVVATPNVASSRHLPNSQVMIKGETISEVENQPPVITRQSVNLLDSLGNDDTNVPKQKQQSPEKRAVKPGQVVRLDT